MNNLMNSNQKKATIINPENAVFILPILIGIFITIIIGCIGFLPLLKRSNQYLETFNIYKIKNDNLSIKFNQLKSINSKLKKYEDQKIFLIKLIAGTKDLKTLFAIINKIAIQNNIIIQEIEPYKIKQYIPENKLKNNSTSKKSKKSK